MRYFIIFTALLLSFSGQTYSQETLIAKGVVYHDLNGNNKKDRAEKGIAGVAVSDGYTVVSTDESGHYQMNIDAADATIFVIKPSAYRYPVNALNLPQFYYIHKPGGSPAMKFPGVEPTGPLPKSVDFALLTGDVSEQFSVVISSDPQPYNEEQVAFYDKDIVEELKSLHTPIMGFTLGDIVGDRPDLFGPMNQATARAGLPWFHVLGNHDMNYDATVDRHADESFESHYGPSVYSFNQGKVHFFVLNDVIYPNTHNNKQYIGGFSERQFVYIEQILKTIPKDYLLVFVMHIPLYNEAQFGETFLNAHRDRLFELLKDRPFTFSLSGHTHTQRHYFFDEQTNWLQTQPHHHYTVGTASGDWWSGAPQENGVPAATMRDGTPNGYNLLHFDGNQYRYEYKVAGESAASKMQLIGPKAVQSGSYNGGELFVNFYQGSEKDSVFFSSNGTDWRAMRYVVEPDPHMSDVRYVWNNSNPLPGKSRPSAPDLNYHLWKTRVSTKLPKGNNTYFIRVKDQFGRVYESTYTFEVLE